MRPRVAWLLAPLLAASLSGCLALAREATLVDRDPFALRADETYERVVPLHGGARHEVRYEVALEEGADAVVCLVHDQGFPRTIDWNDSPVFLEIVGCAPTDGLGAQSLGGTRRLGGGAGPLRLLVHCRGAADDACRGTATLQARSASEAMTAWTFLGVVLAAILATRILADRLDRARIRDRVAHEGGRVTRIAWQPFGRGFFGERGERIYRVEFVDVDGQPREATFKTSLFSGVWTDSLPGR